MQIEPRVTRRGFLGVTAATAGGLLVPAGRKLFAADAGEPSSVASTDHFWYRVPTGGPYVDSQQGSMAFGFTENSVCLSRDNARTWPQMLPFADAPSITFSHVFNNGNILFATRTKLFLSEDGLKSFRPIPLKNADGSDYVIHTPKNPDNPGWYFNTLTGVNAWEVAGKEMLVWGNYCNVLGGATPPNVYYSVDNGQTVKIAYAFGQNPYHSDTGAPGGGAGGTLLGDPDNPVICRHIHCVSYNSAENAFYACTGDRDRPEGHECNWLRGTYDAAKDTWDWKVVVSESLNTRYKGGGINFADGQLYWISDANGPEPHDRGLFRCDPADIANPQKHTRLFDPKYECANMIIEDGVILAAHYATASPFTLGIIYSPDMGKTWKEYDLKEFGPRSPVRFQRKNADGWFRVDLRTGWITLADFMFIKPK